VRIIKIVRTNEGRIIQMIIRIMKSALVVMAAVVAIGAGGSMALAEEGDVYTMPFDASNFTEPAENPYFPLKPGMKWEYRELDDEGDVEAKVLFEVTKATKTIMGVECMIIRDQVFEERRLVEDTLDYFAADRFGNIWYFGEDSRDFERGNIVSVEGSWLAGAEGAMPGLFLAAEPKVGMVFKQEVSPGQAEDMGEVVALDATVRVKKGKYENCLKIREWNPLEPGAVEFKYLAKGVGVVLEEETGADSARVELFKFSK
jgi:hypothetical protein